VFFPRPRGAALINCSLLLRRGSRSTSLSALIIHYEHTDRPARAWWRDAPIHHKEVWKLYWPLEEPVCAHVECFEAGYSPKEKGFMAIKPQVERDNERAEPLKSTSVNQLLKDNYTLWLWSTHEPCLAH